MHHVLPRADRVECAVIARVARTVRRESLEDTWKAASSGSSLSGVGVGGGSERDEERIRKEGKVLR